MTTNVIYEDGFGIFNERNIIKVKDRLEIDIQVSTIDGRNIGLVVRSRDKITVLIKKIEYWIRFNRYRHKLEYQGHILDDDEIVSECDIIENSVVNVVAALKKEIFFKINDGINTPLLVYDDDTIDCVKKNIQDISGMSLDEHRLVYEGLRLQENKTIMDYFIKRGDVITVLRRLIGGGQVKFKMCDGRTFVLTVCHDDTIDCVKKKIQDKIGVPPCDLRLIFDEEILGDDRIMYDYNINDDSVVSVLCGPKDWIRIFVKTMDGKTVAFEVNKNDRIINVKKKIQEKIGLSPDEQKLVYQGRVLEDYKTVDDYKIAERSITNVVAKLRGCMRIYAKTMDGKTIAFEVTKNDRIIDIKKYIQQKIGLSPDEQKLVYEGAVLEDDKAVYDYKIAENSVINVIKCPEIQIFAKTMDGKTIALYVLKNDRIIDIKKKIQEKIGLSPDEQKLMFQGRLLEDDKTVDDYQISKEQIIIIDGILRPIQISVKSTLAVLFILDIRLNDTITDVKNMIKDKINVSPNNPILKFNGNIIRTDTSTVYECGIFDNSVIEVTELMKYTIMILLSNMETVAIKILNIDTISDVKWKIYANIYLPPNDQILTFNNILLDDDSKMVSDYGIKMESDLVLQYRGLCLIINNNKFKLSHPQRDRYEIDVENIKDTFKALNYEIKIHQCVDVSSADIDTIIDKAKSNFQSHYKMLIVFIMSHGTEQGVINVDGAISPLRNFMDPLSNINFTKCAGKPKLLFFQCCQGTNENIAVNAASGAQVHHDATTDTTHLCPALADFFIGYATCNSYCHETYGTFYVDYLCRVIREHWRWSIGDIHQEVHSRLSRQIVDLHFDSRLRGHAYFCD